MQQYQQRPVQQYQQRPVQHCYDAGSVASASQLTSSVLECDNQAQLHLQCQYNESHHEESHHEESHYEEQYEGSQNEDAYEYE